MDKVTSHLHLVYFTSGTGLQKPGLAEPCHIKATSRAACACCLKAIVWDFLELYAKYCWPSCCHTFMFIFIGDLAIFLSQFLWFGQEYSRRCDNLGTYENQTAG